MNNVDAVYSGVTEGTAPNRIHKIQAKNFYRYNVAGNTGNAQIWLHETSNVVELHYGPFAVWTNTSGTAQVGLRGASSGTSDMRSLSGAGATAWTDPTAGTSSSASVTLFGSTVPDSGRIYRFEPVLAPSLGASTKSAAPAVARTGDTVEYTIVIANSGDDTATAATLSDPIPAGTAYVTGSVTTVGGPPDATYDGGADTVEWGPADLASGASVTVTFEVTVTEASGFVVANSATIDAANIPAPVVRTASTPVVGCVDDDFYSCEDSLMPGGPAYSWYDATGGALILDAGAAVGDDREVNVTLPFPFLFYGTESSSIRVGDNGAILFDATVGDVGFSNTAMATAPASFIAPFWDDMDTDTGGTYTEVFGTAPDRVFVVEWNQRPHFSNVGAATFQVLFLEGTQQIAFQYQDMDFGNALYDNGASATVGIKGSTIQYSFNAPALSDGLAIWFSPKAPGIALGKTVGTDPSTCATTSSITVPAGTEVYYCYTVENTGDLTLNLHDLVDDQLGTIFAGFSYALTPGSSVNTVAAGLSIPAVISSDTTNTATWTAYNSGPTGPVDVASSGASATVTVELGDPGILVSPTSLTSDQLPNTVAQQLLTISNTGQQDLTWEILEEPAAIAGPARPLAVPPFDSDAAAGDELEGVERAPSESLAPPDPAARARAKRALLATGLLLVPDSTNDRVMALDPLTGNVIDPDFVPSNSVVGTGVHAILNAAGDRILLSDQTGDVVHQFDLDGNYIGVFAPAGGANTAIMDNIRGIALRPNGNLLVTVASGANADAVAEFDAGGTYLGNFVANAAGGLDSPFDVYGRSGDWLVSAIDSDAVHRYDLTGAFIANLTSINTFPEQVAEAANGNVLVANFSPSAEEGVLEFTSAGVFVGRYDPAGLGGYRGVYELGNGNILTTTGAGVHEIDRGGNLVETKISGISGRFIEYVVLQTTCTNPADVPWLSASPLTGSVSPSGSQPVTVTFDSTGLSVGVYDANLCILSNDPEEPIVAVPVTLSIPIPVELQSFSIE